MVKIATAKIHLKAWDVPDKESTGRPHSNKCVILGENAIQHLTNFQWHDLETHTSHWFFTVSRHSDLLNNFKIKEFAKTLPTCGL